MCGIFAIHGVEQPSLLRTQAIARSKKLRHRGPDWSGCYVGKQSILVHERLAIVGIGTNPSLSLSLLSSVSSCGTLFLVADSGAQPLVYHDKGLSLAVNGEIYNYLALREKFCSDDEFKTHSDCEVILPLVRPTFLVNLHLVSDLPFY
jgi:asparagine synthase (glutamine-hydrolysing)